jgi:Tfp pilus assembly ATPase PilU
MSEQVSVVNIVLRQELSQRKFNVQENVSFKLGRTKYVLDFYLQGPQIGIITMNWRRSIPTNKLLQLEQVIDTLNLKKLILVCNSISGNARDFLARRNIPIQVVHLSEILYKETQIEDLIVSS